MAGYPVSCSHRTMSLVETIRLWQEGVCAADRKEWRAALDAFTAVQSPPAKICYNIGCIHLVLGKLAEAEEVSTTVGGLGWSCDSPRLFSVLAELVYSVSHGWRQQLRHGAF